ncbi:putative C2 domain-containing protein [Helianthus anomalus]
MGTQPTHQNDILSKSNPLVYGQRDFSSLVISNGNKKNDIMEKKEGFIGVLEVFIHQARDLHNICIYHKQDVYANIFLTSDPEATESTQTINGGGQNPVFNESLRINVRNSDCSLRCEIWMLSRVKNYLEDQLLGFALVPLCDIFVENGKLEKEFELSTSELLHSRSGFVKLSIVYNGSPPDVVEIPTPRCLRDQDSVESNQVSCELERIVFPDPKVMSENEIMVSEYYSAQGVVNVQSTENYDLLDSDSTDHLISSLTNNENEISPSIDSESLEKKEEKSQTFVDLIQTEPEEKVVQQEIVDMYLKSMKQFTEALAKMKLPIDKEIGSPDSGDRDSLESNGKTSNGSKGEGPSPKVFYGSRAFF